MSKDMVFMLRAKCPVIARDLDCPPGALVLRRVWAAKPSESVVAAGDGLSPDRTQVQA